MRTLTPIACKAVVAGRIGLMVLAPAGTASAQYAANCPYGYAYLYGYGCVPARGAYPSFYGSRGYGGFPPVYEPFGFAYGGGYRGGDRDGFRGGEFRGGGGGFRGEDGGRGGGGHGGGGHR